MTVDRCHAAALTGGTQYAEIVVGGGADFGRARNAACSSSSKSSSTTTASSTTAGGSTSPTTTANATAAKKTAYCAANESIDKASAPPSTRMPDFSLVLKSHPAQLQALLRMLQPERSVRTHAPS